MVEEKGQEKKDGVNDAVKFTDMDPEKLPDELKGIYKSMQADYTRKTQALADDRKGFETRESKLQDRLKDYGAAEQELNQWREWYKSLEEEAGQEFGADGLLNAGGTDQGGTHDDKSGTGDDKSVSDQTGGDSRVLATISALNSKIAELEGQLTGVNETLRKSRDQTNRMFVYHDQLNKLEGKYGTSEKPIDRKVILDHALKNGFTDLDKAYRDLYQDDIMQLEVDRRVQEELKKQRTATAVKSGQQVIFKPKEGRPTSWEAATEAALKEIGSV